MNHPDLCHKLCGITHSGGCFTAWASETASGPLSAVIFDSLIEASEIS